MKIVHGLFVEHVWDLWREIKPMARSIENGKETLIFDETIQENVWADDNKFMGWLLINTSCSTYAERCQSRKVTALKSINNILVRDKIMWIGKAFHQLNAVTIVLAPSTCGGGAPKETPRYSLPHYMMNPFGPPPIETLDSSTFFIATNIKMLSTDEGTLGDRLPSGILSISDNADHIFQIGKDVFTDYFPTKKILQ